MLILQNHVNPVHLKKLCMKIGLLECDHVAEPFRAIAGDYRDMFTAFLPDLEWVYFDVCKGQFPENAGACDAYLCTGSRYSVYDQEPWILELKAFVREIHTGGQLFIGVCFGHQMLGEAMGGKVEKAKSGWNVGVHRFDMVRQESWMTPFQSPVHVLMMCQDQVVQLPENSTVLAAAATCPVAMFRVGTTMLGVQGHPEFSKEYTRRLMESRRERIGADKVDAALEGLSRPVDRRLIAQWLLAFLQAGAAPTPQP